LHDQANRGGVVCGHLQLDRGAHKVGWDIHEAIGDLRPSTEIDVDGMAIRAKISDELLQIAPAVQDGSTPDERVELRREIELGGMDGDTTRLKAFNAAPHETRATFNGAQMLEGARRPDKVEVQEVIRNVIHVHVA